MIQVRSSYNDLTGKSKVELHRHGEAVEALSAHETLKLIEALQLHMVTILVDNPKGSG